MKFSLEVAGETEKHLLEYEFSALFGSTVIKIDKREVKRGTRWFGLLNRHQAHAFSVGTREPVDVRIEQEHKFPFGLRNSVFVNGRLVKLIEGN